MKKPLLLGAGFAVALAASYAAAQVPSSQFPEGAIPLTAAATGTTAGATATLVAAPGKINYLCGISVSPGSATTAIVITVTTTGLANNFSWSVGAPATAAGVTGAPLTVPFTPCLQASAGNAAVTVVAGALGAGGAGQAVNIFGYAR
jgi:hypothetical protein